MVKLFGKRTSERYNFSHKARINSNSDFTEQVVDDLLKQEKIMFWQRDIYSKKLQSRYSGVGHVGIKYTSVDDIPPENIPLGFPMPSEQLAQEEATYRLPLDNMDYLVFLQLYEGKVDPEDFIRRSMYALMAAKQAALNNFSQGNSEIPYVIFPCVAGVNQQLTKFTKTQESFNEYILKWGYSADYFFPKEHIIILPIPLNNLLGQVLALSEFLNGPDWSALCAQRFLHYDIPVRPPNIGIFASSIHVERIKRIICQNAPIYTERFWSNHPEYYNMWNGRQHSYQKQWYTHQHISAEEDKVLQRANIIVLGCDGPITANEKENLFNEMKIYIHNVSMCRNNPFAAHPAPNIVSDNIIAMQQSLNHQRFLNSITARRRARDLLSLWPEAPTIPAAAEEKQEDLLRITW